MSFKDLVMEWELSNGEKVDISKMSDGYLQTCLESVKDNKESDKYMALYAEAKKRGLIKEENTNGRSNTSVLNDVESASSDEATDVRPNRPNKHRRMSTTDNE